MKEWAIKQKKIKLVEGNIALAETEAIVNAANKSLFLGGGVAGAIRKFGGSTIQEDCNRIGPVDVGEAVMTKGGHLHAKYIIHAVGPVYGEGDEEEKLAKATLNSLKTAQKKHLRDITFPAISTGIFRFPIKKCSKIMLKVAMDFIEENDFPQEIIFCLYENKALSVFEKTLADLVKDKESRE